MTEIDDARIISMIDLTSLDEGDTEETVVALCDRARTPAGDVAAVCVMPAWVAIAHERLEGTGIRVATVANFPFGDPDPDAAAREVAAAVDEGADEVDVVGPWREAVARDFGATSALVTACAGECEQLKVILETGSHPDLTVTRLMAAYAFEAGARFLKTSTGKHGPGASIDAARILLQAVGTRGGVKVSGGIRTREQAAEYIALADRTYGFPATPQNFRIGASSLLDELIG